MHPSNQLDNSALWATIDPATCPCRGYGWMRDDWDVAHKCALHHDQELSRHPEDEEDDLNPFNSLLLKAKNLHKAFRHFQENSGLDPAAFMAACREANPMAETPQEWMGAAASVADEITRAREEAEASARGFSCALEARWADEAEDERRGW